MNQSKLSRRGFIASTAIAGIGFHASSELLAGHRRSANERIQLGFVGIGMMGRGHLHRFLGHEDVQVTAICEIEDTRQQMAKRAVEQKYGEQIKSGVYHGCVTLNDYRQLLTREDVDAVVISTPDHWHALMCLEAARNQKDIYCEKPLTHSIREGRMIVDAVAKNEVVFQTGSQQRSEFGGRFRQAVELIRNGRIGDVKTIRIGVGAPPVPCDLPDEEQPYDIDFDLWLGPAPRRAYNQILCPRGMHRHFPAFRKYREYAGGGLADMGAHHFDIAQWALGMDHSGPTEIIPPDDGSNSGLKLVYANGVEMFHGGPGGCTFEGTAGKIYVNRPVIESDPADILTNPLPEDAQRVYPSTDHRRNWIECIRSRKQPICTAEIGHRTATVCHLANLGYQLQRKLTWDPKQEQFDGDEEANRLRFREPRKGWEYKS